MKEINIAEVDILTVADELEQISPNVKAPVDPEWSRSPAVKVIDCVLSLNRPYDTFVVPRLDTFAERHPKIQRITDLAELIANYPTPHAFVQQELNYNHEARANTLASVVEYVCTIVKRAQTVEEEKETLKQWAIQAEPQEHLTLNIRGFAIAGFQYLRMLFGADTTKPDIYIKRFISETLKRKVSTIESLLLLEAASECTGLSVRAVDSFIWKRGARGEQNAGETNTVRLDPDIAAAFPTEETVNEALRSVLKERDKEKSKMETQTFTASIWREDNWFIAQCLELDIASQGESEESALDNLAEALELYFESPQPSLKPIIRKFEAKVSAA